VFIIIIFRLERNREFGKGGEKEEKVTYILHCLSRSFSNSGGGGDRIELLAYFHETFWMPSPASFIETLSRLMDDWPGSCRTRRIYIYMLGLVGGDVCFKKLNLNIRPSTLSAAFLAFDARPLRVE
jgi:hypothetical protein